MFTDPLRLLIAAWVVVMLGRAGVGAYQQRGLLRTIWGCIRLRHVGGAFALLVLVTGTAVVLLTWVPGMAYGLGDLVGFEGNAVFVPLEEAASRAGPAPAAGPDWTLAAIATAFLVPLALLLPWLAFIEEEIFRAGLERASLRRELLAALVFGLAHLIMLVPIGAALAVAVAGFVYGRVYRAGYARSDGGPVPPAVARAFRPTKRSTAAADEAREQDPGDPWALLVVDRSPERRQAAGVLASTVLHATFNTMIVVLVWIGVVAEALVGG